MYLVKPAVLDKPPKRLNRVQVRAVGGQKVEIDLLLFPSAQLVINCLAAVDRPVVQNDHHWLGMALACKIADRFNDESTRQALLAVVDVQPIVQAHQSEQVEAFALGSAHDPQGATFLLPSVGQVGLQIHPRLVGKVEVYQPADP